MKPSQNNQSFVYWVGFVCFVRPFGLCCDILAAFGHFWLFWGSVGCFRVLWVVLEHFGRFGPFLFFWSRFVAVRVILGNFGGLFRLL